MGIKGLDSILKQNCKSTAIIPSKLHKLNGKKVCVDISELIYKSIRKNKDAHVSGILNLIELCSNWNIKPIIVFDGKSVSAKNNVNQNRINKREKAYRRKISLTQQLDFANEIVDTLNNDDVVIIDNCSNYSSSNSSSSSPSNTGSDTEVSRSSSCVSLSSLSNFDNLCIIPDFNPDDKASIITHLNLIKTTLEKEVSKAHKNTQGINHKKINDIKTLLEYFGIPFIHNKKYEADIICSYLVKNNIVEYCISNDMDMLAFGCNKVIRNLSFSSDLIDVYDLNNILSDLKITHSQFIDICILMGCDYTGKMCNMKSILPLNLIKKYDNIENIIDNLDDINKNTDKDIQSNNYFNYNTAREIFNINIKEEEWSYINDNIDFQKMESVKNELNTNINKYKELYNYCQEKCHHLNNYLIINKISAFMGCNLYKNYKKKKHIHNEYFNVKTFYKYQHNKYNNSKNKELNQYSYNPLKHNTQIRTNYVNDIKNDISINANYQLCVKKKYLPRVRESKYNSR